MLEFTHLSWAVPDCSGMPSGLPQNTPAAYLMNIGQTLYAQFWGRDSTSTGTFLSDAIRWVTIP